MTAFVAKIGGSLNGFQSERMPSLFEVEIDFAQFTNAAGDTVDLVNLPAGTVVMNSGVEVTSVGTGTGTVNTRIGTTAQGTATVLTSAGHISTLFNATQSLVTTATTFNLLTATAALNGKVRVWLTVLDVTNKKGFLTWAGPTTGWVNNQAGTP
jgi:hypothetical protein